MKPKSKLRKEKVHLYGKLDRAFLTTSTSSVAVSGQMVECSFTN